jgi:hypothetical protein
LKKDALFYNSTRVLGNTKVNRAFHRFSLLSLDKVNVEFGIVALAHNLLKVAGIRLATFGVQNKKQAGKIFVFPACFILGTYRTAPLFPC